MEAAGMAWNPVIETDAMAIASLVGHGLRYSVAPACYTIGRWPKPLALDGASGLCYRVHDTAGEVYNSDKGVFT